jgi:predicted small lipoprotein YifL
MAMKKRIAVLLAALMLLLSLAACAQNTEEPSAAETEAQTTEGTTSEVETEETILYTDEPESLDGWLGCYNHYGSLSEEFGGADQGRADTDLIIYQEAGKHSGYLSMEWYANYNDYYEKILVEIRGNAETIHVYYKESFSDEKHRSNPNIGYRAFKAIAYREGDLLFSLRKEGESLLTTWGKMALNERMKAPERGFNRLDGMGAMVLINEADIVNYLRAMGVKEETKPFYQYFDDNDDLQLELYYDTAKEEGVGVYHDRNYSYYGGEGMEAFPVGAYEHGAWRDDKFSPRTEYHDAESLAEYTFYRSYNTKGQLTHIDSYETLEYNGEAVVSLHFIYRANGTLKQKSCSYRPERFGTSRSSENCYYDSKERLAYVRAYLTSGAVEDYYIYQGNNKTPSYRLSIAHAAGPAWEDEFVKY